MRAKLPERTTTTVATLLVLVTVGAGGALAAHTTSGDSVRQGAGTSSVVAVNWRTVAASGSVEARPTPLRQAGWRAVERGDELAPRTVLRTGKRGRVTLTRSASLLIVDPDTELELPERSYGGMETSVVQNSGSVLYEVDSRTNPHFEVITPSLVAGVKGTAFLVTVNDDYTAITVERGLVEVIDVHSGEALELGEGESLLRGAERMELEHYTASAQLSREARREVRKLDKMERRDRRERPLRAEDPHDRLALESPDGTDAIPSWAGNGAKPYGVGAGNGGVTGVDDVAGYEDILDDTRNGVGKTGVGTIRDPGDDAVGLPDDPQPPDSRADDPNGGDIRDINQKGNGP